MNELWLDIPGYENFYQVSDLGKVRSLDRFDDEGKRCNGKLMSASDNGTGYLQITLSKHGICKKYTVHRLVMLAFVGQRPDGCNINHVDGNKHNNRLSNLEYLSCGENSRHAVVVLKRKFGVRGEKSGMAKLTEDKVREIRRLYATGNYTHRKLAGMFAVGKTTIYSIVAGRSWNE